MTFESKLKTSRTLLQNIRFQQWNSESALHQLYAVLASTDGELLDYDGRMLVRTLSDEGAIDTIIEALSRTGTGPTFAHRGCAVLTLFAQEEAALVVERGGFHAIIRTMRNYEESEHVQQACVVALVELARINGKRDQNASIVIDNVVQSMEHHKYSPTLFYVACKALKISCLLGIHVEDDLARRAQKSILDGIILFPSNPRCQTTGRDVLSAWVGEALASDQIQQTALALVTACTILRRAMGLCE